MLVTGAGGFLGANLVRALSRRCAGVHGLVRPTTDLWRLDGVAGLKLHRLDLTSREAVHELIHAIRPEIVYHLASSRGHPTDWGQRHEFLRTNVLGTVNLLEAMAGADVQQFVHIGSSLEYGQSTAPLRESDLLEPSTFRGVSKAAATLLCRQFARERNRSVVILRPFSIYGPWEPPGRLIPTAIRATLRGDEIRLTAADYRHDFVFVDDVVEACLDCLDAGDIAGEIINLGSGQQWTNREVVELIQNVCGRRTPVHVGAHPRHPADTTHWVADISKARRLLGWSPKHTFWQGLEKTVAWFQRYRWADPAPAVPADQDRTPTGSAGPLLS